MRVNGHGLCSCTASNGGATLSTNPYSALSSRASGSPGFCEANPPGPPREPAGTSSSAEALPHRLAHASGALPRAIDTWPPEMTPLLVQFHPAAANSMQVVGGFSTLSHGPRRPTNKRRKFGCQTTRLLTVFCLKWESKKLSPTDWTWPFQSFTVCSVHPAWTTWLAGVDSCLSQPG